MASESVQVIAISICDNVRDEVGGKKSLMGLFTTFYVSDYQQPLPHFAILSRLGFDKSGKHQILMEIRSIQGDFSIRIQGEMVASATRDQAYDKYLSDLTINMEGFRVPREGRYVVNITVEGNEVAQLPFFVKTVTPPQRH